MNDTTVRLLQSALAALRYDWDRLMAEEAEHDAWTARIDARRTELSERIGDLVADLRDAGIPETPQADAA